MRRRVLAALGIVVGLGCTKEPAPPRTEQLPEQPPGARSPGAAKVSPPTVTAPRPRPATLTRVTIKALGMYCEESCPIKVRTALAEVPAVYELGFDLSTESIFVSYDASLGAAKEVTRPMLVAVKAAGFDPWLARETWPDGASVQLLAR